MTWRKQRKKKTFKDLIMEYEINIGTPDVIIFIGALNITSIEPLTISVKVIKFSKKA